MGIERLLEDEHVKAIHNFKHKGFLEIDYFILKNEEQDIQILRNYIDTLFIEDTFGKDHVLRREWRDGVKKDLMVQQYLDNDVMGDGKLFFIGVAVV